VPLQTLSAAVVPDFSHGGKSLQTTGRGANPRRTVFRGAGNPYRQTPAFGIGYAISERRFSQAGKEYRTVRRMTPRFHGARLFRLTKHLNRAILMKIKCLMLLIRQEL
jgi:hypothetical protein